MLLTVQLKPISCPGLAEYLSGVTNKLTYHQIYFVNHDGL